MGMMDESSDEEDPEAVAKQRVSELLQESKDRQAFVAAVQDTLACRTVATDLERARMQLEDMCAHSYRLSRRSSNLKDSTTSRISLLQTMK